MTAAAAPEAVTVVITPGRPSTLQLHGLLRPGALQLLMDRFPAPRPALHRHHRGHHTLELPHPGDAGRLADLLTGPAPAPRTAAQAPTPRATKSPNTPCGHRTHEHGAPHPPAGGTPNAPGQGAPAAPRQRDILLDCLLGPGAGLHVEQVHWRWHGPLDLHRFRSAWQSVTDHESVLRAVLAHPAAPGPPHIVVRPCATPQITHHLHTGPQWNTLLTTERLREFDLTRHGPLRVTLADEGTGHSTRILATYHLALIDTRSMGLLLRSFHRAYLDDGRPHGGERRPGIRDHLNWVQSQDRAGAKAYWTRAAPPADAATLPATTTVTPTTTTTATPAATTTTTATATVTAAAAAAVAVVGAAGRRGHGRTRQHLSRHEASRLRQWAGRHAATESTAVQAAWALLLHRARPATTPVAFATTVSGRGIALDGIERMPGALTNPLPVAVDISARTRIGDLLAALIGRAIDTAAYEWVCAGQIHHWSGRTAGDELTESVLVFQPPGLLHLGQPWAPATGRHRQLAAEGVHMDPPHLLGAHTNAPLTLTAHHDDDTGGLTLTLDHDRARISDTDATQCLTQLRLLLRNLPETAQQDTTVQACLAPLAGHRVPRMTPPPPARLRLLRPGAGPGAGMICLIPPPGFPPTCYDVLARVRRGPHTPATVTAPADAAACLAALRPALAAHEPVLLGGYSGAGALAYSVAQRIAAHGWPPPLVAIGGTLRTTPGACPETVTGQGTGPRAAARDLAAALSAAHAATARTQRPL